MTKPDRAILDDHDAGGAHLAEESGNARFGFEWGLASTIIGAFFTIDGTVSLIFCLILWNHGSEEHGLGMRDLRLAQIGGNVCCVGSIVITVIGFLFAVRGLGYARQRRRAFALPLTGMLLNLSALVTWIIVTIDLNMILETFIRWKTYQLL